MRSAEKLCGRKRIRRIMYAIAGFLIICVLMVVTVCRAGRYLLKSQAVTASGSGYSDLTISYNGVDYSYNKNLYVIFCMGIDTINDMVRDGEIGNPRQSDANFLIILDEEKDNVSIIAIPRDTMTEIDIYDVTGRYIETTEEHFALQYAYGDGGRTSCEMTEFTASRLLYGIPINGYVCFNLRAIEVLNGMIGGTPVTPAEDFEELKAGETVTLSNEQAYRYVQLRDCEEDYSAAKRLERQKQYLQAFIQKAAACTKDDLRVPFRIYDQVSDHMITNISDIELMSLTVMGLQCDFSEIDFYVVPGEQQLGEVFEEYRVDEEALYKMILELFYLPQ